MTEKYGRLNLISILPERDKNRYIIGHWKCDCGKFKEIPISRVRIGKAKSCGCLIADTAKVLWARHRKSKSREYKSWGGMIQRCCNPKDPSFKHYGGRGISICDEWKKSFESFFFDMKECPVGMTLERVDTNRGYEPENCRWATYTDQLQNQRRSKTWFIRGIAFSSSTEAAIHFGVSQTTIQRWVNGYITNAGSIRPNRSDCHAIEKY